MVMRDGKATTTVAGALADSSLPGAPLAMGISDLMAALSNVLARMTGRGRVRTPPADAALLSALPGGLIEDLSARLGQQCSLIDCRTTRTGSLVCRIRADRAVVAKLPLRPSTEPRLRQNVQTLRTLSQRDWVTQFLAARLPAFVLTGTTSGYFYSVETAVAGVDGAAILKAGGSANEMMLSAEYFLSKLHKASLAGPGSEAPAWNVSFESAVECVRQMAVRAGSADTYDHLIADMRARLAAQPIPSVFSHGNFWLGNLLFDSTNNLTGVIDWDCASEWELPALDLIYLLVRTHGLARSASFGEALADWIDARSIPVLDGCIARHCRELSLPTELIAPLSYCSWIQHLHSHCRFSTPTSTDVQWLHRNVRHVLNRWRLRTAIGHREVRRWDAAD